MASNLSPADRDAMIRTVLAEAAQGDVAGQAAVAAVIRNRLAAGTYGNSPTAIVRAPGQFEVWSNGAAQKQDPSSAAYQSAGEVVDAIANGDTDPTGGATHFYSPSGQQAMGRGSPSWAKGRGVQFGGNVFYAPNGPVNTNAAPDPAPQPKAPAMASATSSLRKWGLDDSEPAAPARVAPASAAASLKKWGLDDDAQGSTPAAQPPAPATVAKAAAVAATQPDPNEADASMAGEQGLINGVPIAGPVLLYGMNHAAAAVRALRENVPYSQAVDEMKALSKAATGGHPTAATVGGIAGATIGMAPVVAAAPAAFGVGAGGIGANMLMGAASGGAVGAADATARGENPIYGAGAGALGGGAGPLAGRAVGVIADKVLAGGGQAVNALTNYLSTGSGSGVPGVGRATANLFNQVVDDPALVQQFIAHHGDLAMPADAHPALTGLAGALASKPGPEQAVVRNALMQRAEGASDRISGQLKSTVGAEVDPQSLTSDIAAQRSALVGPMYEAAHANAPPVDVSSVVDTIDSHLKTATGAQRKALSTLRNELVAKPATYDEAGKIATPETYQTSSRLLQNVRQDIDAVINHGDPGLGVERSAVSRNQRSLQAARGALDDALKTQVPGLAEADAEAASSLQQQGAVKQGYDSVMGQNVPHPESFARTIAANPEEVNEALKAGMAGRVYRAFGTGTQRDAVTLNKLLAGGEDGYSAQNLATAFGSDKASALVDTLAREKAFNNTTQSVLQNSETARRTAGNKLLDVTEPGSLNLSGATLAGVGLQGAKALANPIIRAIMESPDAPRNMELARVLTAQGASAQEIIAQLARLNSRNQRMTGLGAGARAALGGTVNRLMLGAGVTNR